MKQKECRSLGSILMLAFVIALACGCSGSEGTEGARSQESIKNEAIRRFSDSGDISEFVAIGKDGAEKMADEGTLEMSESGQRFTADGLDVTFDANGKLMDVTVSEKPYNLYGVRIGDSFDIFDDGKAFTGHDMALIYEDADAVVYAVTDSGTVGGDRAVTIALSEEKITMIRFEMSGGAYYAELYADMDEADYDGTDVDETGYDEADTGAGSDGIPDDSAARFLDSKDASEFITISMDTADQMAGAGYLEAAEAEYGYVYSTEGLEVLYDFSGNLDTILMLDGPCSFCGIETGSVFDKLVQGRVFANSGLELTYEGSDGILYENTDNSVPEDKRAVFIYLDEGAVYGIVYAEGEGSFGYSELIYNSLLTAANVPAPAATGNYRPGMKVDGIYVYDNGTDAICTADVNFSQGYLSVECTGYGGHGLYAYGSSDCQENDTGDYTVSDEAGTFRIVFTDGGLYMSQVGEGMYSQNYILEEAYNGNQIAGADFANSYIIPDSSRRLLTENDLSGIGSVAFLRYAKNEIYARHGRQFTSPDLDAYFNTKNWYAGTIAPEQFNEAALSDVERANVNFIQEYMDQWY